MSQLASPISPQFSLGNRDLAAAVPAPVKVIPDSTLSPCWHVISCFSLLPLNGNAGNDLHLPEGIEIFSLSALTLATVSLANKDLCEQVLCLRWC